MERGFVVGEFEIRATRIPVDSKDSDNPCRGL